MSGAGGKEEAKQVDSVLAALEWIDGKTDPECMTEWKRMQAECKDVPGDYLAPLAAYDRMKRVTHVEHTIDEAKPWTVSRLAMAKRLKLLVIICFKPTKHKDLAALETRIKTWKYQGGLDVIKIRGVVNL